MKKISSILAICLLPIFVSCSVKQVVLDTSGLESETESSDSDSGERFEPVSPGNHHLFHQNEEKVTLRQLIRDGNGASNPTPSKGNTRVLVIPVEFSDFPAEEIGKYYGGQGGNVHYDGTNGREPGVGRTAASALEDIQNTVFGESADTSWYSVASYYHESSYSQLNLNGIVLPWGPAFTNFNTKAMLTAKEFKDNGGSAKQLALDYLDWYANYNKYKEIKDEHGNQMFNSGAEFLKHFDSDNDGYVDLVEIVYSAPPYAQYEEDGKWKYIDNDFYGYYCGGTSLNPNINKPNMSKYIFHSYYESFWGGYYDNNDQHHAWSATQISNGDAKPDPHSVCQLFGEALGLPIYYNRDAMNAPVVGAVDMMAYNVGDHNSVSKSLLGWSNPYVVTGSTEITIDSFTETGDCIYIPYRGYYETGDNTEKQYKNTFNTEYIAIELYTPTGVNKKDSEAPYAGTHPMCPSEYGIKIYHADFRIGLFDYTGGSRQFLRYTPNIVSTSTNSRVEYAHSNTSSLTLSREDDSKIWQLEYLYRDSQKQFITNESLFKQGDVIFSDSYYNNFQMNSGNNFNYRITIETLTSNSATLLIEARL